MSPSAIVISVAVAYLAASLVIGLVPGRRASASAEGYVAGDRGLGLVVMYFITGATIFSSFAFLGAPGWAFDKGAASFYILAYGTMGFVPFYFLGPRAARLGRAFGFVTQAEMVADRFRMPVLGGLMALVSVVAFVPYLALQIQGAGMVLETMTEGVLPVWLGGAIVYGVVLIYVLRSGVLGVGWTNTFQGAFMIVMAWGLGLYLPYALYGGVGPMFEQIIQEKPEHLLGPGPNWSWGQYSTAVLVSIVGFSVWPHLFMKAFTAKDARTLRRTVVLFPSFQVFLVPLFLIGFAGIQFASAPSRPDQILPHLLMNLDIPPVVVGLFCAGALAASMSSGDAMAHAAASIVVRDGWFGAARSRSAPSESRPEDERRLIRWAVIFVVVLSYGTALVAHHYHVSLVTLLLSSYGAVVQFAPVVVATLYVRRIDGLAVTAGLAVGTIVTVALTIVPTLMPVALHAGAYGLAANVLVAVALSLRVKAGTAHDERFLAAARAAEPSRPLGPDR